MHSGRNSPGICGCPDHPARGTKGPFQHAHQLYDVGVVIVILRHEVPIDHLDFIDGVPGHGAMVNGNLDSSVHAPLQIPENIARTSEIK